MYKYGLKILKSPIGCASIKFKEGDDSMLLVDRDIQTFILNGTLDETTQTSIKGGDESCIISIGYDLRASSFAKDGKMVLSCELLPGESVFVQSSEIVHFDEQTCGKISLKNSRIRMGLTLDAPIYQPGHTTRIYFRLTNVSKELITLEEDQKYAILTFEQLNQPAQTPYTGTFSDEFSFRGLADYTSEYANQVKSLDGKLKDLETLEKSIYLNVTTILSIFVAFFTLINLNITLVQEAATGKMFLLFNLAVLGAASYLALLLNALLRKEKSPTRLLWALPGLCFLAIFLVLLIL